VTIPAIILEQTLSQLDALRDPDFVEIRFDFRDEMIDPREIRKVVDVPLIATNRSQHQGGFAKEDEEKRIEMIIEACDAGYEYADLELTLPLLEKSIETIHGLGSECILSHHDFSVTPSIEQLTLFYSKAKAVGGDLVKLIGTVNNYVENLTYLEFVAKNRGCISFGMGRMGVSSRLLSPLVGGAFTYASAGEGKESAPGQLTLSRMRALYRELGVAT
jgi:3-dehydroquinate dehydratase-1